MANPRLGTVNNLTPPGVNTPAGTYDLNFLYFPTSFWPVGQISFDFGLEPTKITGIQKVAQIFLKCFFTPKGSDALNPSYGTKFGSMLVNPAPNFSSSTQALGIVQPSIEDAQTQVVTLTSNNPPASALASVSTVSCVLEGGGLNLTLYLQTQAGAGAQIAIPQPQLNLQLAG